MAKKSNDPIINDILARLAYVESRVGIKPTDESVPPPDSVPGGVQGEETTPPVSADQMLANRLAGPGASPVMPWGTGPRPTDWKEKDAQIDADESAADNVPVE